MEDAYKLSVVIPNYNNYAFITACIESIENQTYPVEEIIVVDDCSTDNSISVIQELCKKYSNVTLIALEKNGRVSHARNVGLNAVKTPYVTFIDADDIYYSPTKLEAEMALIKKFKAEKNQDIIAYSSVVLIDCQGAMMRTLKFNKRYHHQGNVYKKVLTRKRAYTIMRDYCVLTELVRAVGGYNEKSSLYEDLEIVLKLAKNTEFYYTEAVGTGYRQTGVGLSSKSKEEHKRKTKEIFEEEIKEYPASRKILYRFQRRMNVLANDRFWFVRRVTAKLKRMLKR